MLGLRDWPTLCPRCRLPDCLAISRGRRIAQNLEDTIQFSGLQFEPPLDFKTSRRRQIEILLREAHPRCQCHCSTCGPRNVLAQEEWVTLGNVLRDPQLAEDDRMAASSDFEVMLPSRLLGYSRWSLPSWILEGRLEDWTARWRSDWAQLEASVDPTQACPWLLD